MYNVEKVEAKTTNNMRYIKMNKIEKVVNEVLNDKGVVSNMVRNIESLQKEIEDWFRDLPDEHWWSEEYNMMSELEYKCITIYSELIDMQNKTEHFVNNYTGKSKGEA